jgi:hypothetical protein
MVALHSLDATRTASLDEGYPKVPYFPVVPGLLCTLAAINIASAVFALIE